jgi:hypothetical protein
MIGNYAHTYGLFSVLSLLGAAVLVLGMRRAGNSGD